MDQTPENDRLMKDNARRVFSEPDAGRRKIAIEELWARDATLIEEDGVTTGHDAISAGIDALLAQLPPGTVFAPEGDAAGHHGMARLRWRVTGADGVPGPVTGTDIAFVENNCIQQLYVVLDPTIDPAGAE